MSSNTNDPFTQKKRFILAQIGSPDGTDLSPKGSIDEPLLDLIGLINTHPDMVTTSSCSGRLSVFLEGSKHHFGGNSAASSNDVQQPQKVGGKGLGGKWLYISHVPEEINSSKWWEAVKNIDEEDFDEGISKEDLENRYVLYKFEAMILHVKCRDRETANQLYTTAMAAGFRESGIGSNNLVGIRISLKLDVPIAKLDPLSRRIVPLVSDEFVVEHLDIMMRDRFRENFRRRDVLHSGITRDFFSSSSDKSNEFEPKRFNDLTQSSTASAAGTVAVAAAASANKEDKEARRERKRREGLLRQADRQKEKAAARLLKQQLQEQNPE